MADFTATGWLVWSGPQAFRYGELAPGSPLTVHDNNTDGNLDTTDTMFGTDLSAPTTATFNGDVVTIRGNDYGIFADPWGALYIPFNAAVDDLSDLAGGAIGSFPVRSVGDNAVVANCFAAGTRIATPDGARAIETLAPGDTILTADGRHERVVWLARQTLPGTPLNHPHAANGARLVRITRGALGEGLPVRDLVLTTDHALVLNGYLVNAGVLVNGTTIHAEAPSGPLTVYHVETKAHEMLLAEGTPTESFIDYAGRSAFDNYAEYLSLHGADRIIPEMALPRISSARLLPKAIKAQLGISDPSKARKVA